MKIKLLARISADNGEFQISSPAEPRLIILDNDREQGLNRLSEYFQKHLHKTLGKWIDYWKSAGAESHCNCPQGYIDLPADIWKCKLDKSMCSLQSSINSQDWDQFNENCTANESEKKGIFSAITNGKYTGFHHVAGRHLCVMCEENSKIKKNFKYHYEIEMQFVGDLIEMDENELKKSIIKSNLPRAIGYCAICTDCTLETISKIAPSRMSDFKKMIIDYYER